mgnify:CR=1 FL=1
MFLVCALDREHDLQIYSKAQWEGPGKLWSRVRQKNTIGIRGCRNSGKSRLAWISRSCAEQTYWRNNRGHCVTIKYVISTLLAWMSLHVTSQITMPSEVHARDFAWPPGAATFLSNFQSCVGVLACERAFWK